MQQVQLATLGIWELLVILAIVLLIFGAGKLPQLGESLGKGIRNFRRSFKDDPKQVEGEARRVEEPNPVGQLPASPPPENAENAETPKAEVESHVDRG